MDRGMAVGLALERSLVVGRRGSRRYGRRWRRGGPSGLLDGRLRGERRSLRRKAPPEGLELEPDDLHPDVAARRGEPLEIGLRRDLRLVAGLAGQEAEDPPARPPGASGLEDRRRIDGRHAGDRTVCRRDEGGAARRAGSRSCRSLRGAPRTSDGPGRRIGGRTARSVGHGGHCTACEAAAAPLDGPGSGATVHRDRGRPGPSRRAGGHSHSMVAGGLLLMSYTTRLTPGTSLTIRLLIRPRTSYGSFAQSAVMPSSEVTARIATTFA